MTISKKFEGGRASGSRLPVSPRSADSCGPRPGMISNGEGDNEIKGTSRRGNKGVYLDLHHRHVRHHLYPIYSKQESSREGELGATMSLLCRSSRA